MKSETAGRPAEPLRWRYRATAVAPHLCGYPSKNNGDALFPSLLTGTDTPGILKLRVKGKVQLRPMLCKGPIDIDSEYTLLLGATEVGGELVPDKADELANGLKTMVIASPATRRKNHERVS